MPKSKSQKRDEAEARQEVYNKLTIEQKLAKLGTYKATKQRTKLQKLLNK